MLTDFQILGIEETSNTQIIKKAYRTRVKETHPDFSSEEDSIKNHLLFIQINQAYNCLLKKNEAVRADVIRTPQTSPIKNPLQKHSDPAYVFYKTGMKFFMKIHPSQ